jgi:cyanophycinase
MWHMNGLIALVGSGEYLPVMRDVDRALLDSLPLDGRKPRVACLPTAAGREGAGSVNRWLRMGVEHFEELGAEVSPVRIIDRGSAEDPQWEHVLANADLIYFSGGDPVYLYETLQGSRAWRAAQQAWGLGAVYAGCSAGAMILGSHIPGFRLGRSQEGFGVVPARYIVPHFDAMPVVWRPAVFALQRQLRDSQRMIGIDEDTALVGRLGEEWTVMGKGRVHLFTGAGETSHASGASLRLD